MFSLISKMLAALKHVADDNFVFQQDSASSLRSGAAECNSRVLELCLVQSRAETHWLQDWRSHTTAWANRDRVYWREYESPVNNVESSIEWLKSGKAVIETLIRYFCVLPGSAMRWKNKPALIAQFLSTILPTILKPDNAFWYYSWKCRDAFVKHSMD